MQIDNYAGMLAAAEVNADNVAHVILGYDWSGQEEWFGGCLLKMKDGQFAYVNGSQWHELTSDYNGNVLYFSSLESATAHAEADAEEFSCDDEFSKLSEHQVAQLTI